jgi:hypothetical protein
MKIIRKIWYILKKACPICGSDTKVKFLSLNPDVSIEKCNKCMWRI